MAHLLKTLQPNCCYFRSLRFSTSSSSRNSVTVAASIGTQNDTAVKPFEEIPHMRILPLIGTTWAYLPFVGRYSVQKLHEAARDKFKRFGDIHREKFGPLNLVVSYRAEDMETLSRNEGPFPFRGELSSIKAYRESRKEWYKNMGLLILQKQEWRDLRSRTQKHLLKPKAVLAYMDPMQEVAKDLVTKIYAVRDANKEVPDFLFELYKWALESVAVVGLDTRLGCLRSDLPKDSDAMRMINAVQTMFTLLLELEGMTGKLQYWKLFPTPKWRQFTKASDAYTEIAFKYINRALEELKKQDGQEDRELTLLQAMLSEKGLEASGAMVTVADMLFAGIDTTSHYVGFLLYHLARNSEHQERLHQEITQALPTKNHKITPEVFAQLRYLKCCMKESQRLTPVVGGASRILDHDVVMSGYRIPAGTMIAIALQEIYLNEKYYANPLQFLPERWLVKDKDYHPFAYMPFGFGPRSCVGRRLAELEIISLTTEIIRNFKVEYHHEDIGFITRFVNAPDKPLSFKFIER